MKTILFAGVLLSLAASANAQTYTGVITDSQCEVVSASGSAAGAIGGSAVGGAVGSVIGDALFGKSGRALGGLLGAGGGALVGEEALAKKSYRCTIEAEVASVGKLFLETTGKPRNIGQTVVIVRLSDGSYSVR